MVHFVLDHNFYAGEAADVERIWGVGAESMSYKVIARKYRPQRFGDLVGQQHVTRTIANAIQSNRVAHAYIFSGVRGVGKTTTARILAKALNCVKGPTIEPDGTCDACREIAAGTSLDVIEIDAASNRGIDQIRELREMVRYAPASSRYKVVILDEAHQLTDEASNALLKTLEEPPERVVFILATTRAEDLVETIKSRAQLFQFRALTFQEIASEIERITKAEDLTIDSGAVAVLARAAEGSLRDGLSLLEQAIAYSGDSISDTQVRELLGVVAESILDELVSAIAEQSAERALGLVYRLIADGQNLRHFCREAIRHFRNLLVTRVCGADSELIAAPQDERPRLAQQAAQFGEEDLTRFFNVLMATDDELRRSPDPRLHLELGLLKLINAQRLAPLEEILGELRGGTSEAKRAAKASETLARGATAAPATSAAVSPFSTAGSSAAEDRAQMAPQPSASTSATAASSKQTPSTSPTAQFAQNPPQPKAWRAPVDMDLATPSRTAIEVAAPTSIDAKIALASRNMPASIASALGVIAAEPAAAVKPAVPTGAASPRIGLRTADDPANGLGAAQLDAIKVALQGQRFLWSMVEHATRWEIEGAELRLFFPTESRALAEMLQARDPMERLRTVLNQVVGQPLRVCVKLDSNAKPIGTGESSELRSRFEEDPIVRTMLEKFGGQISNVKRPGEE
jgi:DNA polymerase III subunit gamma/tau